MDQCTFQFQTQIHQEPILRTNFNRKIYAMLDLSILIGSLKIFNQWEHSKPQIFIENLRNARFKHSDWLI